MAEAITTNQLTHELIEVPLSRYASEDPLEEGVEIQLCFDRDRDHVV